MGMIEEKDREQLLKTFEALDKPVRLIMFTQEKECEYCKTTRELTEELAGLSDKIEAVVHDFVKDADLAKQYGVDKIPAIVVEGEKDYGIRFFGIPAGYEFTTLIEDILAVSRSRPDLSEEVISELTKINKPVHIQVMISPT